MERVVRDGSSIQIGLVVFLQRQRTIVVRSVQVALVQKGSLLQLTLDVAIVRSPCAFQHLTMISSGTVRMLPAVRFDLQSRCCRNKNKKQKRSQETAIPSASLHLIRWSAGRAPERDIRS